jgi:hypothetical protein
MPRKFIFGAQGMIFPVYLPLASPAGLWCQWHRTISEIPSDRHATFDNGEWQVGGQSVVASLNKGFVHITNEAK